MNLFFLDKDPYKNAEYHIDKHCTKMPLEVAEMLCMASVVNDHLGFIPRAITAEERSKIDKIRKSEMALGPPEDRYYHYPGRLAHYNHPSTIWVRSSLENYAWTLNYGHILDLERQFRNGHNKQHKALGLVIANLPIPDKLEDRGFTKFSLAMKSMKAERPDLYDENNPIQSYRNYYKWDKAEIASWKNRKAPSWW